MSKEFAMLHAARRLEQYLSREYYHLNRMVDNPNVPPSLFQTKVTHFNELVDTLNELFARLTESPTSELFARFVDTENLGGERRADHAERPSTDKWGEDTGESYESVSAINHLDKSLEGATNANEPNAESEEKILPAWQREGYTSYEVWLEDKETAQVQTADDLSLSVNDGLSRYRAEQALHEYEETSERDISIYQPDEEPAHVLPSDNENAGSNRTTDSSIVPDHRYLDHTVDNVRVDNDPTQITGVETAVERYGEHAHQGTEIDVSEYMYRSTSSKIDGLLPAEVE